MKSFWFNVDDLQYMGDFHGPLSTHHAHTLTRLTPLTPLTRLVRSCFSSQPQMLLFTFNYFGFSSSEMYAIIHIRHLRHKQYMQAAWIPAKFIQIETNTQRSQGCGFRRNVILSIRLAGIQHYINDAIYFVKKLTLFSL